MTKQNSKTKEKVLNKNLINFDNDEQGREGAYPVFPPFPVPLPPAGAGASTYGISAMELEQRLAECHPLETDVRRDLTDLEFISIDAAKTQDIDDALYADISDDGWTLYVAIADPTAGRLLQAAVMTQRFRVYTNPDVVGAAL